MYTYHLQCVDEVEKSFYNRHVLVFVGKHYYTHMFDTLAYKTQWQLVIVQSVHNMLNWFQG